MPTWTISHSLEARPCYVYDKHGNRHKGIFLGFYGNKPYALVELDDGSVAKVDIEDMVFADSKKKFQEMGWGDD